MMRNTSIIGLLLGCFAVPQVGAAQTATASGLLAGFAYEANPSAPSGKEWESPQQLALNKEQPHAWFFSFANTEEARGVLPENSTYWQSLDGTWAFHWAPVPNERPKDFMNPSFDVSGWDRVEVPMSWNVVGIQKDGTQKYGTPIYSNQRVIFQHTVAVDDWRGGVMRTPPKDWPTYKARNEVGSYRRTFTVPETWKGRNVYVNFDGVDSFFYLYINGHYVGFSKNSRNLAQFDITPYLVKGENVIAVEVYRNSDASFLESQDMMRLPGIFRSVSLTAKPKVQVRDVVAIPDFDATYTQASLRITAEVRNLDKKKIKDHTLTYTLYENQLYSSENRLVEGVSVTVPVAELDKGATTSATVRLEAGDKVHPWSAEAPWCYVLVGELKNKKGKVVETFSTTVGFRKVELKDTPASADEFGLAGRYFYVNGKTVKLKGVNRHETNPERGHAITRDQMEREVMLMKRANINHVRNSHYPDAPYWYYLCNKYGIYLEDEANIESHEYYYGKESLSHPEEWRAAHVARNMEMVHANVNNPSIVIWSLGNEAGPGKNFVAAYEAIKAFDKSRPVQYERNNDIVDIGSNQYPSIAWVRGAVKGTYDLKYPFHISEYGHSMGNAVGNLIDYWEAIESTNYFMGGAIWEWIDHGLYNYTKDGTRYLGYGGNFGDKPNDGMFCMDGVVMPDLTPKAQYYEVKKVYQNVGVKAVDMTKGQIEIFNKNYFEPFTDYQIEWSLWKDGKQVEKSTAMKGPRMVLGPRQKQVYELPYDYAQLEAGSEYFVKVQFILTHDKPWAKAGYVQMEEQLPVKAAEGVASVAQTATGGQALTSTTSGDYTTIKGEGFTATFDNRKGTLHSLNYGGREVLQQGKGPRIDALRAPVDNDNWAYGKWWEKGLHNLRHTALAANSYTRADGAIVLMYSVKSQAPNGATLTGGTSGYYKAEEHTDRPFSENDFQFNTNQVWTIYKDGSVELQAAINSNEPSLSLARLGYTMELPSALKNYTYYGRGPVNNYNDRETGQFIEQYNTTVNGNYIMLTKPQSMGNREDVRWCALTDDSGRGVEFIATGEMSASALPWSQLEMTYAPHPFELPASTATHLHLDAKVTGLGGNSCGQGGPLEEDVAKAGACQFGFIIRPVAGGNMEAQAKVTAGGDRPIGIERDRVGRVTLNPGDAQATLLYSINGGKAKTYVATAENQQKDMTAQRVSIDLRAGGTIKAWYKENPKISVTATYPKIENVPLQVVFASSQEPGSGNAAHFVDGDPSTIWHSAYGVTVTKYPHWVDFDAAESKTMKGFVYQPRTSGGNGCVKDYAIYVSQDGKTWGEPVVKGTFKNDRTPKRVMFSKPVKARYIRFEALSEQTGQDFASGAEFSLIAD